MPDSFYPGCNSHEEELALLSRQSQQLGTLESERATDTGLRDRIAGALGGDAQPGLPDPAGSAQADAMPDPLTEPNEFRTWMGGVRAETAALPAQMRQEQGEVIQRQELWRNFQNKFPALANSSHLVASAFTEVTDGTNQLPNTSSAADKLIEDVAAKIESWGVPNPKAGDPAAAGGAPVDANAHPPGSPHPEQIPVAGPGHGLFDPGASPDRTAGITGGSGASPNAAPPTEDEATESLVQTLRNLRETPEMAPYYA